MTSLLLSTSVMRDMDNDKDPVAIEAEISAMACLARSCHAQDLVIGLGRSPRATATAHAIQSVWSRESLANDDRTVRARVRAAAPRVIIPGATLFPTG